MILKKEMKKIVTNFGLTKDLDVLTKTYLDKKFLKINGHVRLLEKDYNEFKLQYNKQSVEEFSFQKTVKLTIQILHDKSLFDICAITEEELKSFLFSTRRRPDLNQVNDDVIQ